MRNESIANVIKQAGCPVPDYMIGFKKIHSKVKRRLEKKPPKRNTICTTPRFLMKKKGKAQKKEPKQTAGTELPAAEQEEVKKTKGGRKKAASKGRGKEKRKNTAQKMGSNSSGVKLKKKKSLKVSSKTV